MQQNQVNMWLSMNAENSAPAGHMLSAKSTVIARHEAIQSSIIQSWLYPLDCFTLTGSQ